MNNSTENPQNLELIDKLGRVAVLFGGTSSEREISLNSGAAVLRALSEEGVDVVPVDVRDNPLEQILAAKADRIFIALHGPGGEDGKIQALLEFLQLPYTGSGVAASALAMDKVRTKQLWQGVGLPTPAFTLLNENADWENIYQTLGPELIVKPCHEGSSIGMARVSNVQQLKDAYAQANQFDSVVLAEKFIQGAEYTVAILGEIALAPIKLETPETFYDFHAKYQSNDTRYICPCGLDAERETQLRDLARQAFDAIGARGWGRVDVMADDQQNFYLLELNTVPGMTDHSLVPMAARHDGLTFNQLVINILANTLNSEANECEA